MPYSGIDDPDLPSNVKKMGDADKKKWIGVFNSCMDDGGTDGDCMKTANGVIKNQEKEEPVFARLIKRLREYLGISQERSLSGSDLYNQVAMQAYESSDWAWLIDLYFEESNIFAILAENGKLYKAQVTVDTATNTATLAERTTWTEVMHEFTAVSQQKSVFRITEENRWFLIAGTTVLNRNGFIDSAKMFDGMIEKCESGTKEYPYLTYYHLKENFRMGSIDFLARDGVVFIASGVFDNGKVAQAMKERYAENPDIWGASIGFFAAEPVMVDVAQGIQLPVYEEGYLTEISILKEEDACALMTALRSTKEVKHMNKRIKEALELLAGKDSQLAEEFCDMVDEVNQKTEDQGLIHRAAEPVVPVIPDPPAEVTDPVTEPIAAVTDPPDGDEDSDEFELTEEAIKQIATATAKSPVFQAIMKTMQESIDQARAEVVSVQKEMADMHSVQITTAKKYEAEFAELKKSDELKQKELLQDLSLKQINKTRVTYRPTQSNPAVEEQASMRDIAHDTAKNLN